MLDYSNNTDRWRLLSKELVLKQEVINRNKSSLKELTDKLKEKGNEIVLMRSENFLLDQEIYELDENLAVEREIQNMNERIPPEISELTIHELRGHLLSASQEYLTLMAHNKTVKEKLKKCALAV